MRTRTSGDQLPLQGNKTLYLPESSLTGQGIKMALFGSNTKSSYEGAEAPVMAATCADIYICYSLHAMIMTN